MYDNFGKRLERDRHCAKCDVSSDEFVVMNAEELENFSGKYWN